MREVRAWVNDANAALLIDLYELTMLEAYLREDLHDDAVFSLFVRRLPRARNYLLACGLDDVLHYLETLSFSDDELACLDRLQRFSQRTLDWLARFRFTGAVRAVAEGTPIFPQEPLLEIRAPLPQAQLVETFVVNQMHVQTVLASKVARVVTAARGRPVIDFGLRRSHGTDAGMKLVRAGHIAGLAGTSNVLASCVYGVPAVGTMAHSYVQAHDDELAAFAAFARAYPDAVLLVDTYDSIEGIRRVIELAARLGADFRVHGVRLDSGDLALLAREARRILDAAGLHDVTVFASGGLDEHEVAALVDGGAPVDGFGVGTLMNVAADAPYLDMAYKLVAYAGRDRTKRSPGKVIVPGAKQVYRVVEGDEAHHDVLAREEELHAGTPLLELVMSGGRRLRAAPSLDESRALCRVRLARLPERLLALSPATPGYQVALCDSLRRLS